MAVEHLNKHMAYFTFNNIRISGISCAVPTTIVKVEDFIPQFGEEAVKTFQKGTGIHEFRKSAEHQTASDLCFAAAENILYEKNIDRNEIGALVFIAHSTDYRRPATACVLHKRLNLSKSCIAFDVGLGCSAFVYGLNIVCSLMQNSDISKALLLCGETLTKMVNSKDKSVAMLFGDAGSATLLEKTTSDRQIKGLLKTDGTGYKAIIAPAGGFRNLHATNSDFEWKDGNIRNLYNTIMQGDDVFGFTISAVPRTIKEFLEKTETNIDDYDCLAFHQANQFINQMLCKKLKANPQNMPICLDRFGNTSAPAIPMVVCDKYGQDNEDKDINFLMCGFGVGLSWGVCSTLINKHDIYPIIETNELFDEGIINNPEDFYNK